MDTWVVIAAFNEEKKISEVIQSLQKIGYKSIVVVDDGSKDKTYQIAESNKVDVLRHIINRGQGAALKTGIDYALGKGADIIVTFDADGQHDAREIERLVLPIKECKVDVTLGSRFIDRRSNPPFVRKVILKGGAVIFRIMYGVRLTDSHNGFRALSAKAAQRIDLTQDGMEHASEIVEEISKKRLRYCEVPVTIRYTSYSLQHGQKSSNAFRILFKMILNKLMK